MNRLTIALLVCFTINFTANARSLEELVKRIENILFVNTDIVSIKSFYTNLGFKFELSVNSAARGNYSSEELMHAHAVTKNSLKKVRELMSDSKTLELKTIQFSRFSKEQCGFFNNDTLVVGINTTTQACFDTLWSNAVK